jgi:malto-oligosyltrehalose synthase/4-alpha-glucanotransferase
MKTYNPVSTYRLQFNKDFNFNDAGKILTYLHKLGIKTLYASPVLQSVKGSSHGYDVTNPEKINPEIGTEESFRILVKKLHSRKMGWLQDIVPNHMAYSTENPWIYDILQKGKDSEFYDYFDILNDHPDPLMREKIMLPFFGKPLQQLIIDNELILKFKERGFVLSYFDTDYPVPLKAYTYILTFTNTEKLSTSIEAFVRSGKSPDEKNILQLHSNYRSNKDTRDPIDNCLLAFNSDPEKMKTLVAKLDYLPVYWKETEERINYRRFFTINGLICLNIQEDKVFRKNHEQILKWIKDGMMQGLRIDHVDGLYDPGAYIEKLREKTPENTYLAVEKILIKDEKLPDNWAVQGATGYEFLAMVNNLLANSASGDEFYSFYRKWSNFDGDIDELFYNKKKFILENRLRGELEYLAHLYKTKIVINDNYLNDNEIKSSISAFLLSCPLYKIYNPPSKFTKSDKQLVSWIFRQAEEKYPEIYAATEKLKSFFFLDDIADELLRDSIDNFFMRCMQFTGPLTAKGIEDTSFYSFNPFLAFNEVGDSPEYFALSTNQFHEQMKERQLKSPLALNTLATHDTKRGEDARARLNVLTDIPETWERMSSRWAEMNKKHKQIVDNKMAPTPNDEYFIYQTLCAHLPVEGIITNSFSERLNEYIIKAFREAKVNTSWSEPDMEYEKISLEFIAKILEPGSEFSESLTSLLSDIIPHGIINSLTQLILKNAVPGVPDTYQGTESWNFSFVDPDNRTPVDYAKLNRDLSKMTREFKLDPEAFCQKILQKPENGKIKQWFTYISLKERVNHPDLFLKGSYQPLKVKGKFSKNIIAFYRKFRNEDLIVVLPLNTASLPMDTDWNNTRVILPDFASHKWENRITRETHKSDGILKIAELFTTLPFAYLRGIQVGPERKAGILMHISSLPGTFGIGDFGPGAKQFVDFLNITGQSYWQILPLSQTNNQTGYSPYSSFSAFAGNILFVDPNSLKDMGLLKTKHIKKYRIATGSSVDFKHAEKAKRSLLDIAFQNFLKKEESVLRKELELFKEQEKFWLNDFALFMTLKDHFNNKAWNEWPDEYKGRNLKSLENFKEDYKEEIEKVCFNQFIFSNQWKSIKAYANDYGIEIFGDIPVYIGYDSADVWAHPRLFRLHADFSMKSVAGVPPDYFNENGQLWGMPLFDWKEMQKEDYNWWLKRIEKNLEWFDLLRLDHFRGFSAYWEVPAGSETAKNGKWVKGPGEDLFNAIKRKFPDMPFVAEDLGQIDQAVYDLRDQFELPGMRIVQFGFGENMPFLHHNPGNYTYNSIVYTGTHDNNTLKGWYRKEANKKTLKRFRNFTGNNLKNTGCHLEMIRLAYSSVAKLAIIPMQDWLGLDESARMNFPSTTEGNWKWKLSEDQLSKKLEKEIREMVKTFGRH